MARFDDLEQRLASGGFDPERLACCTGEEMALHLVVDMADTLTDTGALDDAMWIEELPRSRDDDDEFEWARNTLLRDHDVLWLFDASLDGIEADDSAESRYFGLAHIHPHRWFDRFDDSGS